MILVLTGGIEDVGDGVASVERIAPGTVEEGRTHTRGGRPVVTLRVPDEFAIEAEKAARRHVVEIEVNL